MLKLVVFDWDGTLANSVPTIIRCKQVLAKKYNTPAPSDQQVYDVLGLNFEIAISRSFPDLDGEQLEKIGNDYHELMQTPAYYSPLFPGVAQMLQSLKDVDLKLAIATSKVRSEFINELDEVGLNDVFDLMLCGGEHGDKPHPEKLHYIMQQLNVGTDQTIMVGDTRTDMQFAHNAGVDAVGVTFGAHDEDALRQEDPELIVSDWVDFIEKITQLKRENL